MKHTTLLFISTLLACASLFAQAPKKNVSVLPFVAKGVSETEAEGISDLFAVGLVKTGRFTVLDRANMQKILEEQSFQNSGCTDSACAVEIGKLLNMDYMFTGSVIKLGELMYLTANIIDISTGQVKRSQESQGFTFTTVKKEIDDLVLNLTDIDVKSESRKEKSAAAREGKKKKTDKPQRDKKNSSVKPALIISGLSVVLAGGIINGLAYVDNKTVETAEDEYLNAATDFSAKWDAYQDARGSQKVKYAVAFGAYSAGAVLAAIGFIQPKRNKSVSIIPYISPGKSGLAFSFKF